MLGGAGNDRLYTVGSDRAYGGADADQLWVGPGDASAYGEGGRDWLIADRIGSSRLFGGAGDDRLEVLAEGTGKLLHGGAGNDGLESRTDGATLNGSSGDDGLTMRFAGLLVGGDGDDILTSASPAAPSKTVVSCGAGEDRVNEADTADVIGADCEDVTVHIVGDQQDNDITGTEYDDDIGAQGGDDRVLGLEGDDSINAFAGLDSVDAGPGHDTVFIDTGSYFQIVGDVDDVVCGPGDDTAYVDDIDTVAADCETVYVGVAPR